MRELDQMLRLTPDQAHLARLGAVMALQCAQPVEVERAGDYLRAAAAEPKQAEYQWLRALELAHRREIDPALAILTRAHPDHYRAQDLRLRLLRQTDRATRALPLARDQVERRDDNSSAELREQVAWACAETGDLDCAVRQSIRAALLGNEASVRRLSAFGRAGVLLARGVDAYCGAG